MHVLTFMLPCLACMGQTQRMQSNLLLDRKVPSEATYSSHSAQLQEQVNDERIAEPLQALAAVLLAGNSAAAFTIFGLGARTPASKTAFASLRPAGVDQRKGHSLSVPATNRFHQGVSMDATEVKPFARLVFSRHGESTWNKEGKFTGWVDVDLTEKGEQEAIAAGRILKEEGITFDVCFTSVLKRAVKTCNLALEFSDQMHVPVHKTWRLNERMYGNLQGLDKKETVRSYGADQVKIWRRSYDLPPPPIEKENEFFNGHEEKYKDLEPSDIPTTESLKDVISRVMPYWRESIEVELRQGKTVFVAAHGNSIRAIVKDIEGIPDNEIPSLEIPTAIPLVYELDADLKPIPNSASVAPLKFGRYLGDPEKIRAAAAAVRDQTKV